MKKIAALLLSLVLVLGMTGALADEAKISLSLGVWPQDTDVRGLEVAETYQLPAFEELRPDVEVIKAPYEYNVDTFIPLVESGNLPNLFNTYFTEPQKMIQSDFVADITDQLEAKGWLEKIDPSILDTLTDDNGRVYGIPRDAYPLGLMINAELFRDAGLVDDAGIPLYPKTWDELIEAAKTIKEETGSAGFVLLAKDNAGGWHFTNIAWTFGAEFETYEDGKWVAHLNSPEVVEALQMVRDMKWEHDILTSDPTIEDWGTGFQHLGAGTAAMYIAADDAVNQPTANNGLPTEDLMMVGIPAGPAGSYSLMGGTLFMFSKESTPDQIDAGLDWLQIIGYAPSIDETTKEGKIAQAKNNVELGVPVMKSIKIWNDEEYNAVNDEIYEEYLNVDPAMFAPYYEATSQAGALRGEEPVQTQDLYAELTKAMQEVLTNEDADVQATLDVAQENFQKFLDENVNN